MIFNLCLAEINRIGKTCIDMANINKSIQYKEVDIFEEKENIKKLLEKVVHNYRRDLQCKILSYNTEIMAIENEILLQFCIRVQRRFRNENRRNNLVSLDEIKEYQKYMVHLKEELINTRLDLLLYSEDLISFKNNYLDNHTQSMNNLLLKYDKSIIDLRKHNKELNRIIDSSYETICKLAIKMKMSDIMKIQGRIKSLKDFPRHKELLDDFTENINV